MAFVGFGGFNRANQAAILQQQANDMRQAQAILGSIGYVPQGGPTLTHGNANRAVHLGAQTFIQQPATATRGLGVDLNRDGRYNAGTDGQLALDLDGNGIYNQKDVRDTLDMLTAFSGGQVPNADGKKVGGFNQAQQARQLLLQARGKQADLNQDGVLSTWELQRLGAKVMVKDTANPKGPLQAHDLPGTYQPQPGYFGGYSPYGAPMSFGPPAYFFQLMQNFMSFFPRPY